VYKNFFLLKCSFYNIGCRTTQLQTFLVNGDNFEAVILNVANLADVPSVVYQTVK
jgi:hypothetical protein